MKKILFGMMAAVALVSCDPTSDKFDMNQLSYTGEDLSKCISFVQRDADGNIADDGNYITYATNPATNVCVYTLRADGSENVLANGPSGSFELFPSRGSDPNQTIYVRAMNADGTVSGGSASVNVFVLQELDPAVRVIASDAYGSKVWKWDAYKDAEGNDVTVWGNMGYCGGSGVDVALNHNGQWWGVGSEADFLTQPQHCADGFIGDESMDATMVFADDGTIKCFDANGNLIRSGSYKITNYDPSDPAAWKVGDLETSEGAILWPYQINWKDNGFSPYPTKFDICYLTADKMCLVYPDGGAFDGLGNWGEATYWHFTSNSDLMGFLAAYDSNGKNWTWDYDGEHTVWGNMGYCGGSGADVALNHNGQWWGVTSEDDFLTQEVHAADGFIGDESMDAYMTFKPDGTITSYNANSEVIRTGTFELSKVEGNDWKVADLKTSAAAILWPYQINWKDNGLDPYPTQFEVVYLTPSKMTLVYPDGGAFDGLGNWGEATYWHFKAK